MKFTNLTGIVVIFWMVLIASELSEAWWSRSSSSKGSRGSGGSRSSSGSSSSSSSSSKLSNAKDYVKGAKNGAKAMLDAYNDMKEANWKNSDKYFHARGNYDAAKHGPGGKAAAKVISNVREAYGWLKGDSAVDRAADQEANKWGRNGGDPNKYRPKGLPEKYKK